MLLELLPTAHKEWIKVLNWGESTAGHTDLSWKAVQRTIRFKDSNVQTTPWLVQALLHATSFRRHMDKEIFCYDHIIEFGAGIGELARCIFAAGFHGRYEIYDFPETQRISSYYLNGKAKMLESTEQFEVKPGEKTLFIATWSLSETPVESREAVVKRIKGADTFIAFQTNVWEYNNPEYFLKDFPRQADQFVHYEPYMPDFHYSQGTNAYLFGRAK